MQPFEACAIESPDPPRSRWGHQIAAAAEKKREGFLLPSRKLPSPPGAGGGEGETAQIDFVLFLLPRQPIQIAYYLQTSSEVMQIG